MDVFGIPRSKNSHGLAGEGCSARVAVWHRLPEQHKGPLSSANKEEEAQKPIEFGLTYLITMFVLSSFLKARKDMKAKGQQENMYKLPKNDSVALSKTL